MKSKLKKTGTSITLAFVLIFAAAAPAMAQQTPEETQGESEPATKGSVEDRFEVTFRQGSYHFVLRHDGVLILKSHGYATQEAAERAIAEVLVQGRGMRNLRVRALTEDSFYFIVQDRRGNVLATSPLFETREDASAARSIVARALID